MNPVLSVDYSALLETQKGFHAQTCSVSQLPFLGKVENFYKIGKSSRFFLKLLYPASIAIRYTTPRTQRGTKSRIDWTSPSNRGPVGCSLPISHFGPNSTKGKMMAKRCAFLMASLVVMTSAMGCCCGYGRSACSPCSTGGCAPSYYPPGGGIGYNQGFGSTAYSGTFGQTAYVGDTTMMTASPTLIPNTTYSTTALAPVNSLPTY